MRKCLVVKIFSAAFLLTSTVSCNSMQSLGCNQCDEFATILQQEWNGGYGQDPNINGHNRTLVLWNRITQNNNYNDGQADLSVAWFESHNISSQHIVQVILPYCNPAVNLLLDNNIDLARTYLRDMLTQLKLENSLNLIDLSQVSHQNHHEDMVVLVKEYVEETDPSMEIKYWQWRNG